MQWLQDCFLGYIQEWQSSIDSREGFTKGQKQMMCLARETVDGLKMTGIIIYTCHPTFLIPM